MERGVIGQGEGEGQVDMQGRACAAGSGGDSDGLSVITGPEGVVWMGWLVGGGGSEWRGMPLGTTSCKGGWQGEGEWWKGERAASRWRVCEDQGWDEVGGGWCRGANDSRQQTGAGSAGLLLATRAEAWDKTGPNAGPRAQRASKTAAVVVGRKRRARASA